MTMGRGVGAFRGIGKLGWSSEFVGLLKASYTGLIVDFDLALHRWEETTRLPFREQERLVRAQDLVRVCWGCHQISLFVQGHLKQKLATLDEHNARDRQTAAFIRDWLDVVRRNSVWRPGIVDRLIKRGL